MKFTNKIQIQIQSNLIQFSRIRFNSITDNQFVTWN